MKDHELDLALGAMGRDRTAVAEPPTLRERVTAIPFTTSRRRGWLPHFDTGRYTMFSAVKFIAAAVIVALFGGFLLAGILTTPQGDELAPAAVTESPSPMATEEWSSDIDGFPTGKFVSVDTGRAMLEFHGDGTGTTHSAMLDTATPFTYAVDGDVYTALKGPWVTVLGVALAEVEQQCGPATYRWDHDGERLAFELIGEDTCERRKSLLQSNTFRAIEDPVEVMAATRDIEAGAPVWALLTFVPAAEAGPDAYTSKAEYLGHVAAVPISEGQPITPDLLKLRPSE